MTNESDAEKVAPFSGRAGSVDRADRGGSLRARRRAGGELVDGNDLAARVAGLWIIEADGVSRRLAERRQ